jgi:hypothetical protein
VWWPGSRTIGPISLTLVRVEAAGFASFFDRSDRHAFESLPPSLESGSAVRVLAPGELLFRQGDPAAAIYKVESGRLRLVRHTVDDQPVILFSKSCRSASPLFRATPIRRGITYFTRWPMPMPKPRSRRGMKCAASTWLNSIFR